MNARRWVAAALDLAATGLQHLAARVGGGPMWCVHMTDDGTHEYPLRDAVTHEPSQECACGPTVRRINDGDGDEWTYRHHGLTQTDQLEDYT